jgi:hypothetical protein
MPIRLDTVIKKVEGMPNTINFHLLKDFYQYMKEIAGAAWKWP